MKNKALFILLGLSIAACGPESFTTEAGTKVIYLKKGDSSEEPLKEASISYMDVAYYTEDGKVMHETKGARPMKLNGEVVEGQGEIFKVLSQLRVGDSVNFKLLAEKMFSDARSTRPDSIPADSYIDFYVYMVEQKTMSQYNEESAEERKVMYEYGIDTVTLAKEQVILDAHFGENNIEPQVTENGVSYVITEQGDGPKPRMGQWVKVHYTGKLLTGEVFDTSVKEIAQEQGLYDERREPYDPYPIQLYLSSVILGWHEGIAQLNEGSKATLYIPSPLGYGPRGAGEFIKPNSIIVFDVEIVELGD